MNILSLHLCPRILRTMLPSALAVLPSMLLCSCTTESEPYPNLLTEFADIRSNHAGRLTDFTLDSGTCYTISNTNIALHRPDTVYRAVVGYVPGARIAAGHACATLYSLASARVLADSTAVCLHDPMDVLAMWASGPYINMQLTVRSQGGMHYMGYAVDACDEAGTDGRMHSRHRLSLHHRQGTDPMSYSATYYCSISPASLPSYHPGDTVTVSVHTFAGWKEWNFCPGQ